MKQHHAKPKRILSLVLGLVMILSLAGCDKGRSTHYRDYVESLISANYLGIYNEYIKLTGTSEEDADALYLQNVSRLADNLSSYYGLEITNDDVATSLISLSKEIYAKTRFEVSPAYENNNVYYVDVTVYPMDIIRQTNDRVVEYVEEFNQRVEKGDYDNFERSEYETTFASGLILILTQETSSMTYLDPVTIKVRIITSKDSFYISNDDFRAIDAAILATQAPEDTADPDDSGNPE